MNVSVIEHDAYDGAALYGRAQSIGHLVVSIIVLIIFIAFGWNVAHSGKKGAYWGYLIMLVGVGGVGYRAAIAYATMKNKTAAAAVGTVDFVGDVAKAI